mmetsp:Transcript_29394/g.62423  ORF Transcript_29394/g.62423 Transcript_29394/m.62423 type:complete len:114 (-) Transcript_29394:97-438(-)
MSGWSGGSGPLNPPHDAFGGGVIGVGYYRIVRRSLHSLGVASSLMMPPPVHRARKLSHVREADALLLFHTVAPRLFRGGRREGEGPAAKSMMQSAVHLSATSRPFLLTMKIKH